MRQTLRGPNGPRATMSSARENTAKGGALSPRIQACSTSRVTPSSVARASGLPRVCAALRNVRVWEFSGGTNLVERSDAVSDGELDERGEVVEVELAHQADAVGFHRARGEAQLRADFGVGFAVGDEAQDIVLGGRQFLERARGAAPQRLEHLVGAVAGDVTFSGGHLTPGFSQLSPAAMPSQVAARARLQRALDHHARVVHRKHDDCDIWLLLGDGAQRLEGL